MPNKPPGEQITLRGSFNWLCILCTIHARCVQPFLRFQTGVSARGWFAIIAGLFMFYAAVERVDEPLMIYFAAWSLASIIQMMDANGRKGVHSQYDGRPWLASIFCNDESRARLIVEPLICLGVGNGLLTFSDFLGKLVMSAGFSLAFLENYHRHVNKIREQQIIDARLEAEALQQGVDYRLGGRR